MTAPRPLAGRVIVTSRDAPGALDELLASEGADVLHVPLIEIAEPLDAEPLAEATAKLDEFDWLVVTSRHGASRVGSFARRHGHVRLAAVGTATAAELARLAGRHVDVVPARQTAADLVAAMPRPSGDTPPTVLVAHADRADVTLRDGLVARGYRVTTVVAYRTSLRIPTEGEIVAALAADAVVFASGSAATAWARTIGARTPPIVIAIGPTTARVAASNGLDVTHVATDHSIRGLLAASVSALAGES